VLTDRKPWNFFSFQGFRSGKNFQWNNAFGVLWVFYLYLSSGLNSLKYFFRIIFFQGFSKNSEKKFIVSVSVWKKFSENFSVLIYKANSIFYFSLDSKYFLELSFFFSWEDKNWNVKNQNRYLKTQICNSSKISITITLKMSNVLLQLLSYFLYKGKDLLLLL